MEVVCPFVIKTVREAAIGELICFLDEQGGELAIKIAEGESGYPLLAGFSSLPERSAQMIQVSGGAECVSYGEDWIFEIGQQSRFHLESVLISQPGAARVSEKSICLRFGPNAEFPQIPPRLLNMRTFAVEQNQGFAYWTKDWKLWASAEERDRLGGKPLLVGLGAI